MTVAKIAIRDAFAKALVEAGLDDRRVIVLDADIAAATRTALFAERIPERFVEVGIAEQNMMGMAAGLAACGKIPFAASLAVFSSRRALDQVAISICYPRLNVKIVGAYVGLFTGKTGATHQAFEDVAVMRALPNMVVVEPADAAETERVVRTAVEYDGPMYIRIGRDVYPDVIGAGSFKLGKAIRLREGGDLTIAAAGATVGTALEAAALLEREGLDARVLNVHTIKPIDVDEIEAAALETRALVTVENHSIIGGLGSAVAEVLCERAPAVLRRVGVRDCFGESGSDDALRRKYGLTAGDVVAAAKEALEAGRGREVWTAER